MWAPVLFGTIGPCRCAASHARGALLRSQEGALDFEDFMALYVMDLKDGPNDETEMIEAFQAFDKAGNGFIMTDDLKAVSVAPRVTTAAEP